MPAADVEAQQRMVEHRALAFVRRGEPLPGVYMAQVVGLAVTDLV